MDHNINSLKGYSYFGNGFSRKLKHYQVDYSILTGNIGAPFTGNLCSILLVYIFIYNIDTYIKSYLYFMNEGLIPSGWTSYGLSPILLFWYYIMFAMLPKKGQISAEKMVLVVYHGLPLKFFFFFFCKSPRRDHLSFSFERLN